MAHQCLAKSENISGMRNNRLRSEIGYRFQGSGQTPPPNTLGCTPGDFFEQCFVAGWAFFKIEN